MSNFEDVKKFMETFGQMTRTKPQFPNDKTMKLRFDLIQEELNELEGAMKSKNLTEIADALTDILYVTYGAGYAYGINLDKCFMGTNLDILVCEDYILYKDQQSLEKVKSYKDQFVLD